MKNIIPVILLLFGCSRSSSIQEINNSSLIVGKFWRAYSYSENGTNDPAVVNQNPTFEFRGDGKMYFSQIGPVYKDTFSYEFTTNETIRLTKPSTVHVITWTVDLATEDKFDFTVTSTINADIEKYKTNKL